MKPIAIAVLSVAACLTPAIAAAQTPEQSFVGAWTLVSFENFAEDGEVTRNEMTGSIIYTESGRMAAQLMPKDYEKRERPEGRPADRRGNVAYWGRFELDPEAGSVTHHVEGSIIGPWVGVDLVRHYEIEGDVLKLSLRDEKGRTTGTLTWQRTQ